LESGAIPNRSTTVSTNTTILKIDKVKLLRIAMNGEESPHYTLTKAFSDNFSEVKTIWWEERPREFLNNEIINEVTNNKYDAVFLQIQHPNIINESAAIAIHENSIGFNWTGDVRTNIDWYINLGKYFVTLFTNMTDVEKMRSLGLRADYLQIGYDHNYYYPEERICHNNIVFCGNYYAKADFPLTGLRREFVQALRKEFGNRFNLYGGNWKPDISPECEYVNNQDEAEIYRTCAIAINCSHFDYSRYSSDRLFREMASGAFVLSHAYKDYNIDFENKKHLVVWNDIPELIEKCYYYLDNESERNIIAKQGCDFVQSNANWDYRIKQFVELITKYRNA